MRKPPAKPRPLAPKLVSPGASMPRTLTVATWNINSVRLRAGLVRHYLRLFNPDVLCLQETKTPDEKFPHAAFKELGYEHIALNGQKGYHGVATLSRIPFASVSVRSFCGKNDARHVAVTFADGTRLHNFYVPAGGDEPDPEANPKFAHKLGFLTETADWFGNLPAEEQRRTILVGDLNVAPLEHDVWSHKELLTVVSHTPIEVDHLARLRTANGFVDVTRQQVPEPEKVYTWWSYRAADWRKSDRGRRLDHIWVSTDLAAQAGPVSIHKDARGWERPSDHVPLMLPIVLD